MSDLVIRTGGPADLEPLLRLLDDAVRWLAEDGHGDMWGTVPFSARPGGIAQATGWVNGDVLFVAEVDGAVVGALGVGARPPFVPPPTQPELYLTIQVVDRAFRGRGISGLMMDHARDLARSRGVGVIRGDCWAGADGAVLRHYRGLGFDLGETFTVDIPSGPWPGQVIVTRV